MALDWLVDKFLGVVGKVLGVFSDRRRLRVTVHCGYFRETGRSAVFINVTNLSRQREVEITHAYFDLRPPVHAIQASRPLPKRLKPDESWETWVVADRLPADLGDRLFKSALVRLSTGRKVRSRENKNVPTEGSVPGGLVDHG